MHFPSRGHGLARLQVRGDRPKHLRQQRLCDGSGSCTLWAKDTPCGSSSCSGLIQNTPRTCDGKGNCRDSQLVDCFPFVCSNGACLQNCAGNQDCAPENQCQPQTLSGVTRDVCGQKQNGQSCSDSGECVSGQCVDKVCCENHCTGACRSCALPNSPGRCLNVASGAPDPRNICKDHGASSCSTNGLCNGNGDCQAYPIGTVCASQTCVSGVYSPPSTCNASGQCVPSPSRSCDPYVCNGSTCYDTCTSSNAQCVPGNVCTNASCGLKPNGANCGVGTECKSRLLCPGRMLQQRVLRRVHGLQSRPRRPGSAGRWPTTLRIPGKCAVTASNICGTTGTVCQGDLLQLDRKLQTVRLLQRVFGHTGVNLRWQGCLRDPERPVLWKLACVNGACKTTCTVATQAQDLFHPTLA